MIAKQCTRCRKVKLIDQFYPRDDTIAGYYAFCIQCCEEQGRSPEYPDEKERGAGVIKPNYKSLKNHNGKNKKT